MREFSFLFSTKN